MDLNWLAVRTVPSLLDGAAQVWRLRASEALLAQAQVALSPDERERAARIRAGLPRREFIVARGTLRLLLGHFVDRVDFVIGPQGKPSLAQGSIDFNVTHSGGCILLALSRAGEVGVDIESLDRKVEALDLARAHFHPREAAAIADAPDEPTRMATFFRCWTRKEAIVKADGRGLQLPFASFSVLDTDRVDLPGHRSLYVRDLPVESTFAAALAFPNREIDLQCFDLAGPISG